MDYYSAACWLSSVDSSRLHEALCCYSSLGTEQRGKSAHAKQGRGNAGVVCQRETHVGEMMNFPYRPLSRSNNWMSFRYGWRSRITRNPQQGLLPAAWNGAPCRQWIARPKNTSLHWLPVSLPWGPLPADQVLSTREESVHQQSWLGVGICVLRASSELEATYAAKHSTTHRIVPHTEN